MTVLVAGPGKAKGGRLLLLGGRQAPAAAAAGQAVALQVAAGWSRGGRATDHNTGEREVEEVAMAFSCPSLPLLAPEAGVVIKVEGRTVILW